MNNVTTLASQDSWRFECRLENVVMVAIVCII